MPITWPLSLVTGLDADWPAWLPGAAPDVWPPVWGPIMLKPRVPNQTSLERPSGRASPVARRGPRRHWGRLATPQLLTRWLSVVSPGVARPLLAGVLGLLLSVALVPVLTYWPGPTGALRPSAPLLFLLPVVLAATLGGWWSGAGVTVVAVAIWDWFFLLPAHSLAIDSTDDVVTLLVYLSVAALLGQLSMAMRRRATAATQHEAELAAVLDVAKAVASTLDLAPLLEVVLERVQRVVTRTYTCDHCGATTDIGTVRARRTQRSRAR